MTNTNNNTGNTSNYDMNDPNIQYYLEKLNSLIRGELIIKNEEGMKLLVEGSINLERFLDCYINTRKEIKYEFLTKVMQEFPNDAMLSKKEVLDTLRALIDAEPQEHMAKNTNNT